LSVETSRAEYRVKIFSLHESGKVSRDEAEVEQPKLTSNFHPFFFNLMNFLIQYLQKHKNENDKKK